jgi:hypothetical protein
MAATARAGCLIVLDSRGTVRETISGHGINGPWDMAALGKGLDADLLVTNVLNGTVAAKGAVVNRGTVLRLLVRTYWNSPPKLLAVTKIGSGFSEQTNASAFIIGPTGVGLDRNGTLYVADTGENRITGIPYAATRMSSAGTGFVLTSGGRLNAPLGLVIAPNSDVLTVNGGDGRIVETSTGGPRSRTASWTAPAVRPAPALCSAWPWCRGTAASTTWTTAPTHCGCCTNPGSLSVRLNRPSGPYWGRVAPPPVRPGGLAATRRRVLSKSI